MIRLEINNNNKKNEKILTTLSGKWPDCFSEYLDLIKYKQEIINNIGTDLLDKVGIIKK